uniref:Uncharacterized protein n=1 Tax=Alexandrium catenella TaxID=2925 RepID=A0A7S1LLK5_ALECA|mmetsp:Transcript_116263/g.309270  ORF Transcript_116263/g.309270 Transcript_116263/m.309270 type:complete len:724 (+) Transcript_116263:132-2303(+)
MSSSADLVQHATERLEAYKSPSRTVQIKRLTQQHGLSDEVQLALRLLSPDHLKEILAGGEDLRQKLAEVSDKDGLMRSLISMLDPDVEALVSGLQAMEGEEAADAGAEDGGAQDAGAQSSLETLSGDELLAEAQRRLEANKSATSAAAIKKFARDHELGDEVQLALRMLDRANLEELLAGEADIQQKFAQVGDRDELMLSLVSALDADVVGLVKGLQALEQQENAATSTTSAGAAEVPAEPSAEELVAEAERRLAANKTATSVAAISRFAQDYQLSESVQLALRLLDTAKLEELLAGEDELQQKFAEVADRDRLMMSLIAMLDSEVESLVSGLQQVEQGQGGQQENGDLVSEAQRRLESNKTPVSDMQVKKLTQDHGLSEEVQLALRLLAPDHLKELVAGGKELQRKLQQVPDRNKTMLDLVEMLDPDVDRLVKGLMHLDQAGAPGPTTVSKAPAVPAGKGQSKGAGKKGAAPTTNKAGSVAPPSSKAPPAKRGADGQADGWADWGGDSKRQKGGEGDGGWNGWQDSGRKGGGDSWKGSGDSWNKGNGGGDGWGKGKKGGGDTWSKGKGGGDSWNKGKGGDSWSKGKGGGDGWNKGKGGDSWSKGKGGGDGWDSGKGGGDSWKGADSWNSGSWKSDGDSWKSGGDAWKNEGVWSSKPANGHAEQRAPKPAGDRAVVPPKVAPVPPKNAPVCPKADGGSGGPKKKPKCMICKGDHRAADCPKMK